MPRRMSHSDQHNPSNPPALKSPVGHKLPEIDILEHGAPKDGVPQEMNRRLFFQLLVFSAPTGSDPAGHRDSLVEALGGAGIGAVVYEDVNDPRGLGVLTFSEDPADFVTKVRPLFGREGLRDLIPRNDFTMLGRTYSSGYEDDLVFWLIDRPASNAANTELPWAVWYPLRRTGPFAKLSRKEQGGILREHATIGRAYGAAELATDVRLACHGLDANDNEFVIGLIGNELHPLSHVVQTMRKTRQTSEYIQKMGPFFVGHMHWSTRG